MALFSLKNSVLVLLIASIIIGLGTIILSLLFYKNKFKRLIETIIMLSTNIIIWLNMISISENILEIPGNSIQRYFILVIIMISLFIIASNNILSTCYLFNSIDYLNKIKASNNSLKRFGLIILPLPLFYLIKWILIDNGYLQIFEFLRNL
ncbi:hypothetical protein BU082_07755 [Staphylococcus warneri]|nr:hypothetical protein BU082_07755 [Staphylococcus warneri]RIN00494.1 hypothetical protein BU093_00950 [Staphylococcus warneri]RIN07178.1 hypothetical protein BU092_00590 [Staphylococcus warneri]